MEAKHIEIKPLLISLAAIVGTEILSRWVISQNLHVSMMVLAAARVLEIILILLIVLVWGQGLSSIGLSPSKVVQGAKRGLIWSAGLGGVVFAVAVILFFSGIDSLTLVRVRLPVKSVEIALFFIIGGVVAPIAEELFFRGILYGFLRRWGVIVALTASTLSFVLAHPVFPGIPIPQLVGGIVFAVAYEVEGSLMVPITIHALGNLGIFSLSLIT